MKLISRNGDDLIYTASFWEGPLRAGEAGRRVNRTVLDRVVPRYRTGVDGERKLLGHRFANTSPSVSYYAALEKACGVKWGAA